MRLTCPRCRLSLTIRNWSIAPAYCPRCLVRRREAVELVTADARDGSIVPERSAESA
ncbi:MAG TPA: hypothetical protein VG186_10655 [Solirubrobacteraceae bacterium]|jgi:hypothetical protein|nr:hypothetical protein [Solirubrobacteraceae bacterium]